MSEKPTYFNQAMLDALREAFDGDNVPMKNIMLRRAYDTLAVQEPAPFVACPDCITEVGCKRENRCKWPGNVIPASEPALASAPSCGASDRDKLAELLHQAETSIVPGPKDPPITSDGYNPRERARFQRMADAVIAASEPASPLPEGYDKQMGGWLQAVADRQRKHTESIPLGTASEPAPAAARQWCQPGDVPNRAFMVRFDDPVKGYATFDNEAEARVYFERANTSWNCYLFATLPREPALASAPSCCGAALEKATAALKLIASQNERPSNSPDPMHEHYLRTVLIALAKKGLEDSARAALCQCGELREALERAQALAKKMRNASKLVGPAEYQNDPKALKVWQRALYHEGKELMAAISTGPRSEGGK